MKTKGFKIRVSKELVAQAASAQKILENTDIGVLDAARLVKELSELGRTKKLSRLRSIFRIGCDAASRERRTPNFREAFKKFLVSKSHLRERSICDYRQVFSSILSQFPTSSLIRIHTADTPTFGKILEIAFNKTVSGQSYLYPLIPFNGKALMNLILRKGITEQNN